jgi:hypothetical protein
MQGCEGRAENLPVACFDKLASATAPILPRLTVLQRFRSGGSRKCVRGPVTASARSAKKPSSQSCSISRRQAEIQGAPWLWRVSWLNNLKRVHVSSQMESILCNNVNILSALLAFRSCPRVTKTVACCPERPRIPRSSSALPQIARHPE